MNGPSWVLELDHAPSGAGGGGRRGTATVFRRVWGFGVLPAGAIESTTSAGKPLQGSTARVSAPRGGPPDRGQRAAGEAHREPSDGPGARGRHPRRRPGGRWCRGTPGLVVIGAHGTPAARAPRRVAVVRGSGAGIADVEESPRRRAVALRRRTPVPVSRECPECGKPGQGWGSTRGQPGRPGGERWGDALVRRPERPAHCRWRRLAGLHRRAPARRASVDAWPTPGGPARAGLPSTTSAR